MKYGVNLLQYMELSLNRIFINQRIVATSCNVCSNYIITFEADISNKLNIGDKIKVYDDLGRDG
jgi:hypothetical protein